DAENNGQGSHIYSFENNYYLGKKKQKAVIKTDLLLETQEEINAIAEKVNLPRGGNVETQMSGHLQNDSTLKVPITLCRALQANENNELETKYYVENTEIDDSLNEEFANALYSHAPNILYFKTFENKIDETITIPKAYLEGKDVSNFKEWRDLLQEIFKNASKKTIDEEYSIQDFLELSGSNTQGSVLRAINKQLNEDIMSEWKRLSKDGRAPTGEDLNELSLEIQYIAKNEKGDPEFKIKVVDQSAGSAGKEFSINDRSTGLRWFFNFIIKLKYNFDYKKSGTIFLLDEPGSNLHSTAQQGLLNKLAELSSFSSPIIFGTHSEDLLDPELINVSSIKIAKREGHKVLIKKFNKAGYRMNEGAWTPLKRALHLKTGFIQFLDSTVIITEGITDYYLFRMIQEYTDLIDKSFKFVPGAGAHHLKELISISIASSDKYLVLLDSDSGGETAYKNYLEFFKENEAKNFYKYETPNKKEGVMLEDFLSQVDRDFLNSLNGLEKVNTNYVNEEIKNAIILLFH